MTKYIAVQSRPRPPRPAVYVRSHRGRFEPLNAVLCSDLQVCIGMGLVIALAFVSGAVVASSQAYMAAFNDWIAGAGSYL